MMLMIVFDMNLSLEFDVEKVETGINSGFVVHLFEEVIAFVDVILKWVSLSVASKGDAITEMGHGVDVALPVTVDDA
jgi:predicted ABC-type ATPase